MDGKAKRDNIFTTILFSKKSLLIAISVAGFFHFIGWQLVVMTAMSFNRDIQAIFSRLELSDFCSCITD